MNNCGSLAANWPVIHWDQAFLVPRGNLVDRDLPERYISTVQRYGSNGAS